MKERLFFGTETLSPLADARVGSNITGTNHSKSVNALVSLFC